MRCLDVLDVRIWICQHAGHSGGESTNKFQPRNIQWCLSLVNARDSYSGLPWRVNVANRSTATISLLNFVRLMSVNLNSYSIEPVELTELIATERHKNTYLDLVEWNPPNNPDKRSIQNPQRKFQQNTRYTDLEKQYQKICQFDTINKEDLSYVLLGYIAQMKLLPSQRMVHLNWQKHIVSPRTSLDVDALIIG
jgi:hypothetical protein